MVNIELRLHLLKYCNRRGRIYLKGVAIITLFFHCLRFGNCSVYTRNLGLLPCNIIKLYKIIVVHSYFNNFKRTLAKLNKNWDQKFMVRYDETFYSVDLTHFLRRNVAHTNRIWVCSLVRLLPGTDFEFVPAQLRRDVDVCPD